MKLHLIAFIVAVATTTCHAETKLERGAYLVNVVGACGNCHSPVDANGNGQGSAFSGGPAMLSNVFRRLRAQHHLRCRDGHRFLERRPDRHSPARRQHAGRPCAPAADAVPLYRALSDSDAHAIAAYLKTLPAIDHQNQHRLTRYPPLPVTGRPSARCPTPPRDDLVAYGAYLAKLGHCVQCHTAVGSDGRRDYVNHLGAGGLSVDVAWGSRVSANITPDPKTGIGTWTDDQIIAALSHGTRPSGESLSTIMPWPYWQTMKRDDLLAIVAWLRTLKPVVHTVDR